MSQSAPRSVWTSHWAFILVTMGSAVGLGNIWRFSYMAGSQGGSAFVLVYLACVLVVGLPLFMAEILIGRRGRGNPVSAMLNVAGETGNTSWWGLLGWLGTLGALVTLSYYAVVAGWIVDYFFKAASGVRVLDAADARAQFEALLASPGQLILWFSVFLAMTAGVVARGVVAGIEKANKVMMPALFLILILLTLWGAVAGDMRAALEFMFEFKPSALNASVILAAMGHAFFSLSVGMGALMVYGSYLDRETRIAHTSLWVALADTLVGLLAGLAIFSLTFAYGLKPSEGPGLILQTLPLAFARMPGGQVFALLFFALVIFATWTSAISLLEPFVAWLTERFRIHRPAAAWGTMGAVWCLGVAVCLSFNLGASWSFWGLGFFDALDFLCSRILMPLTGLFIALFVGWAMGRGAVADEMRLKGPWFSLWFTIVRFVSPLVILLVFCAQLGFLKPFGISTH